MCEFCAQFGVADEKADADKIITKLVVGDRDVTDRQTMAIMGQEFMRDALANLLTEMSSDMDRSETVPIFLDEVIRKIREEKLQEVPAEIMELMASETPDRFFEAGQLKMRLRVTGCLTNLITRPFTANIIGKAGVEFFTMVTLVLDQLPPLDFGDAVEGL